LSSSKKDYEIGLRSKICWNARHQEVLSKKSIVLVYNKAPPRIFKEVKKAQNISLPFLLVNSTL
jgi:hypothetical protein